MQHCNHHWEDNRKSVGSILVWSSTLNCYRGRFLSKVTEAPHKSDLSTDIPLTERRRRSGVAQNKAAGSYQHSGLSTWCQDPLLFRFVCHGKAAFQSENRQLGRLQEQSNSVGTGESHAVYLSKKYDNTIFATPEQLLSHVTTSPTVRLRLRVRFRRQKVLVASPRSLPQNHPSTTKASSVTPCVTSGITNRSSSTIIQFSVVLVWVTTGVLH